MEFDIPLSLAELENPQHEGALAPRERIDVAGMSDGEANDLVERVAYDLCENDALCILEQDVFDQAYACVRDFTALKPIGRIRLTDSLCSNLSVLTASVSSLLASGAGDANTAAETLASHREALKCYSFLVHHIADVADAEARVDAGTAAATAAPGAGKADKKGKGKKASAPLVEWKWEEQRERVMHVMAGVLDVDLWNLFRPRQPSEQFLGLFTKLACLAMESQPALRSKITKGAAFDMLGSVALKWGQLENVTTALVHLLNKHEHLPGPIAECAAVAADRHENARLAAALLREVASVDPAEYKRQMMSDAKGVTGVGVFVSELSQRMPKTTMTNISLLLPHLDGEAYALRSALVTVLGHLVCSDASSGALDEERDRTTADGAAPLLRAKQGFLDLLVERVHDTSAFTRARVLQTWSSMAEKKAVPLSHWLVVADLAIGRLNDKAALVRKAAMNLLATMLGFNPFAPQLPSTAFAQSLKEYEAKLAAMKPPEPAEEEEEARPETIEEGDEEKPADEEKDPDEEKDAEEDAPVPAEEPTPSAPELDGGLEAVRTMVAALKTALGFAVQMSGAVGVLCRLLASSTPSDAIEATGLLVRLRQFGVDGADEGVRRMLALVFSRDTAVRDAAVEAVDVLFLAGADSPVAAAAALADVAAASALGELAALEEVIKRLVADGRVPPTGAVIRALWAQATAKELPDESRAAAFTVLAMAAAARTRKSPPRTSTTPPPRSSAPADARAACSRAPPPRFARASGRERGNVKIGRRRRARARARRAVRLPRWQRCSRRRRRFRAARGTPPRSSPSPRSTPCTPIPRVPPRTWCARSPPPRSPRRITRRRTFAPRPSRDFSLCSARWACDTSCTWRVWRARCAARASPAIARLPRMPRRRPRRARPTARRLNSRRRSVRARWRRMCISTTPGNAARRSFSACRAPRLPGAASSPPTRPWWWRCVDTPRWPPGIRCFAARRSRRSRD